MYYPFSLAQISDEIYVCERSNGSILDSIFLRMFNLRLWILLFEDERCSWFNIHLIYARGTALLFILL